METTVRPSTTFCPVALSSGRAFCQPAVRLLVSTLRPPSASPSGTDGSCAAAWRAAACAACMAAMACAVVARFWIERWSCWLACCCCADGLVSAEAGMPFGSRPVAAAVPCIMFFWAIQSRLKACWACALSSMPPAATSSAIAWASGRRRGFGSRKPPPYCGEGMFPL
ncbi:hypothetical protein D3C72_1727810 [compost metagenome]